MVINGRRLTAPVPLKLYLEYISLAIQSLLSAHSDGEHFFINSSLVEPAVILLKNKHRFSHSRSVPSNSQTRAIAVKRGLEKSRT